MTKKFVISGAGPIGLLTAQALKSRGIDFVIFDRDTSVDYRESSGWAITLHWALETFKSLLPQEMSNEIYEAQVRPNFHLHDTGNFKYINAATGETIVSIPPTKRLRVRREQIRRMLLRGIDVHWGCKTERIEYTADGVKVICTGGKEFEGHVLIGAEGANSITRRLISPGNSGELYQLPIRFCGARVPMAKSEVDLLASKFDPLLFQGTVPRTNTFFWFSILSCPESPNDDSMYAAQVNLSWNTPEETEPFSTNKEKAAAMKKHAEGLCPELHYLIERAAGHYESIIEIKLCDWDKVEWDTQKDRVLLAGDAAHAMTMYRGEAANHGITDVADLVKEIDLYIAGKKTWHEAVESYCTILKARAAPAVLLSRQACLDAHDFSKIKPDSGSPLLGMRKKT